MKNKNNIKIVGLVILSVVFFGCAGHSSVDSQHNKEMNHHHANTYQKGKAASQNDSVKNAIHAAKVNANGEAYYFGQENSTLFENPIQKQDKNIDDPSQPKDPFKAEEEILKYAF